MDSAFIDMNTDTIVNANNGLVLVVVPQAGATSVRFCDPFCNHPPADPARAASSASRSGTLLADCRSTRLLMLQTLFHKKRYRKHLNLASTGCQHHTLLPCPLVCSSAQD